jgi:hypothetical protein
MFSFKTPIKKHIIGRNKLSYVKFMVLYIYMVGDDINVDCQNKLKEEYCQRLLDAIDIGNDRLAIFLIDDLIKKNIDVRCDDSIPFYYAVRDTVCSTLWLASILGRFTIVEHLIKTGEFDDCILETVRWLILEFSGIIYDDTFRVLIDKKDSSYGREHHRQHIKEKHNKTVKMLKLLLSYVKPNSIRELKAISENYQESHTFGYRSWEQYIEDMVDDDLRLQIANGEIEESEEE